MEKQQLQQQKVKYEIKSSHFTKFHIAESSAGDFASAFFM